MNELKQYTPTANEQIASLIASLQVIVDTDREGFMGEDFGQISDEEKMERAQLTARHILGI